MKEEIIMKCVITGKEIIGKGHSVTTIAEGRCTDEANVKAVIPYRLFLDNKKRDQAMLLKLDYTIELIKPKDKNFSLEEMQGYVERLIELYPHKIDNNIIICNKEGLIKNLPYNDLAKLILDVDLVGNVIVSPTNLDSFG